MLKTKKVLFAVEEIFNIHSRCYGMEVATNEIKKTILIPIKGYNWTINPFPIKVLINLSLQQDFS
jgi:hypothetical protein